MPTVSRAQQKLMHGIASGSIKGGKGKPSKKVAQEFVRADHTRGHSDLPQRIASAVRSGKAVGEV